MERLVLNQQLSNVRTWKSPRKTFVTTLKVTFSKEFAHLFKIYVTVINLACICSHKDVLPLLLLLHFFFLQFFVIPAACGSSAQGTDLSDFWMPKPVFTLQCKFISVLCASFINPVSHLLFLSNAKYRNRKPVPSPPAVTWLFSSGKSFFPRSVLMNVNQWSYLNQSNFSISNLPSLWIHHLC